MYEVFSQISNFLSEPFINIAYSTKGIPLLSAFILGLIGALAPCQFTANLGAITIYGNQSLQRGLAWKEVTSFIAGKIFVFTVLGLIVWIVGKEFQSTLTLYFPWVRRVVGPFLIIIGLFMLGFIKMNGMVNIGKIPERFKKGKLGAFFMGVSFSLGFCPTMFVLFFITLMPMVLSTSYGAVLPSVFAIGTSVPLIITILLIWYFGMDERFMKKKGRRLGAIVQKVAGWTLIAIGVIDTITYWS